MDEFKVRMTYKDGASVERTFGRHFDLACKEFASLMGGMAFRELSLENGRGEIFASYLDPNRD